MRHNRIVTENGLDTWVRGNNHKAQGLIVELVCRLVAASAPRPKERRFPLGDSIGQPGPDGFLDTVMSFEPFVPEGKSYWEIGVGEKASAKATSDYKNLTQATPEDIRKQSIFTFVTPLSGRKDWAHTWKPESQASWLKTRREKNEWRDVQIIDGSKLIEWLFYFPSIEKWLANKLGFPTHQIQTPEERWDELQSIGAPPLLIPDLFLLNRDRACEKLQEIFSGTKLQLKLDTHYKDQVVDFVAAYIAAMSEDEKIDTFGRCLIISDADAWDTVAALTEPHVFVADFNLDEDDLRLLQKARKSCHAVIFGGSPGGIPHPDREAIPNPKDFQIKETLKKAGYSEERARVLARKSDGNISSLLRCLHNLSLMPEWAEQTHAAELVIAELLGGWNENFTADLSIAERLLGKSHGEWIEKIREITLRSGTPLVQQDGIWKVISRYEVWHVLGRNIFDEHLNRLRKASVTVLCEIDPKFELRIEERYMASIRGKVLAHSKMIRYGLAESLALLGSYPKTLTSCSSGKAEEIATLTVRDILASTDWMLWASLDALLPLFAEAAPNEFLSSVEKALASNPCLFDTIFAQESNGITGDTYISGLLWALETLAWDAEHLTRVVVILGELATHDPGGKWVNRPENSLSTIFIPWYPQTCAPISKRKIAVETLAKEFPEVAWKLLLKLLPAFHQSSSGSCRPAWRKIIPDDWQDKITHGEYWEQIEAYANLALTIASTNVLKLSELIERLNELPQTARTQLLDYLSADKTTSLPQADRLPLWSALLDLISRYPDSEDSTQLEVTNKIEKVAQLLAPTEPFFLHQRLFCERNFQLLGRMSAYEEEVEELEKRRQIAIAEILSSGGIESVIEFARVNASKFA